MMGVLWPKQNVLADVGAKTSQRQPRQTQPRRPGQRLLALAECLGDSASAAAHFRTDPWLTNRTEKLARRFRISIRTSGGAGRR
jgi:hypothetical protein